MMEKIVDKTIIIFLFSLPYLSPSSVSAASPCPSTNGVDIGCLFGYGYLSSLGETITKLVGPTFSFATIIVVLYLLWGAWDWLTSEGDKERVATARNKITHAITGFLILMLAFFILQFILHRLFQVDLMIIGT